MGEQHLSTRSLSTTLFSANSASELILGFIASYPIPQQHLRFSKVLSLHLKLHT